MEDNTKNRIPCPFCAELILPNAIKCRYCSSDLEVVNQSKPSDEPSGEKESLPDIKKDKYGQAIKPEKKGFTTGRILLNLGVIFIPFIFAWFTLSKRYSNRFRIASFSWLAFIVFVAVTGEGNKDSSTAHIKSPKKKQAQIYKEQAQAEALDLESLSNAQKAKLCEVYIAVSFGRPTDIINSKFLKEDGGATLFEIFYTRPQDGSEWHYVCKHDSNLLLWAALDDGVFGRWRHEEEASLSVNKESLNSITIAHPSLGTTIVNFKGE